MGPITALSFVLTLEDPARFADSRIVGAYLGLCPAEHSSGERARQLRVTKAGDVMLRRYLVQAAHHILGPCGPDCDLRRHGLRRCERGGKNAKKRAAVAVARKLVVVMHHLWLTGETYEPSLDAERAERRHLFIYDLRDPSRPAPLGEFHLAPVPGTLRRWSRTGSATAVAARGGTVFLAVDGPRVHVLDATDASHVELAGMHDDWWSRAGGGPDIRRLSVDGHDLWLGLSTRDDSPPGTRYYGEVVQIDVSDAAAPRRIASWTAPGGVDGPVASDGRVYVASSNDLASNAGNVSVVVPDDSGTLVPVASRTWDHAALTALALGPGRLYVAGFNCREPGSHFEDHALDVGSADLAEVATDALPEEVGASVTDCDSLDSVQRTVVFGPPVARRPCIAESAFVWDAQVSGHGLIMLLSLLDNRQLRSLDYGVGLQALDISAADALRPAALLATGLEPSGFGGDAMAVADGIAVVPLAGHRLVTFDVSAAPAPWTGPRCTWPTWPGFMSST